MSTPQLSTILDQIGALAAAPESRATTLPPSAYASQALLERERTHIFAREWICVGRDDEIADTGGYFTTEVNGAPVVVVRQKDTSIAAFLNVCAHRASILIEGAGCVRAITCPYHAWSYGIDGRLLNAPRMGDGFDPASIALRPVAVTLWNGFIFLSLADSPAPLQPRLAGLDSAIAAYGVGAMRSLRRETLVWRCNWKILVENGLEAYHLSATHPRTLAPVSPVSRVRMQPGPIDYFHYLAGLADGYAPPPADPAIATPQPYLTDHERRTAIVGGVFPGLVFSVASDWVWWIAMQPISASEVRIDHGLCGPFSIDPAAIDPTDPRFYFLDLAATFNEEDRLRTEAVQRGAASGYGQQAPLSPLETGTHRFARYLADRLSSAV
ncbi:aromatic ring-hydroxylating oxygenase subunit alpha [Sphingomonas colocasiae]|uniref:Aromatic ring-hydroxylating dioxygenase subunit alpha n=1 Tax=Sphingomonas colocasiae TaxID=1848973 RepID=A0ABS7PPJ1_9SPHN|nr:aromatic ring-hydroxylating dioxygenase subunit alpha [Sphingomonas colocasiae]MBY8821954.1 aromatic ring-hydroxylating dioxygenase subunit alpha [Sphingomonas colocasiae]